MRASCHHHQANRSRAGRLLRPLAALVALLVLTLPAVAGMARSAAWNARPTAAPGIAVVLQTRAASCGPAVIATLAALAGAPVGEAAVLAKARTGAGDLDTRGITLAEFARLATMFGAPGTWFRVSSGDLGRLATPFVAQLEDDGGHFVAVLGVRHGHAVVADPAIGAVAGPLRSVLPGFSGRVFLLEAGR